MGRGGRGAGGREVEAVTEAAGLRVANGEGEAEALAGLFVALAEDRPRLEEMERAARAYVDETAHWSHVADTCIEALGLFPTPRISRRGIGRNAIEQRRAPRG